MIILFNQRKSNIYLNKVYSKDQIVRIKDLNKINLKFFLKIISLLIKILK